MYELRLGVPHTEIPLEAVPKLHPVSLFSNFWFECKGDAPVPLRQTLDPFKVPTILPWLILLEAYEADGQTQFRYRLTGTGCREMIGSDYTGKRLGEGFTPDAAEARVREVQKVMSTGEAVYSSHPMPLAERSFINVFRGIFPVSLTGENIDQMFIVMAQEDKRLNPFRHSASLAAQSLRLGAD